MTFQSTLLCNISTVNALKYYKTSYMIRSIERFDIRGYWGIDMNEARQLYIRTHSCIDSIDQLVKTASLNTGDGSIVIHQYSIICL